MIVIRNYSTLAIAAALALAGAPSSAPMRVVITPPRRGNGALAPNCSRTRYAGAKRAVTEGDQVRIEAAQAKRRARAERRAVQVAHGGWGDVPAGG